MTKLWLTRDEDGIMAVMWGCGRPYLTETGRYVCEINDINVGLTMDADYNYFSKLFGIELKPGEMKEATLLIKD